MLRDADAIYIKQMVRSDIAIAAARWSRPAVAPESGPDAVFSTVAEGFAEASKAFISSPTLISVCTQTYTSYKHILHTNTHRSRISRHHTHRRPPTPLGSEEPNAHP